MIATFLPTIQPDVYHITHFISLLLDFNHVNMKKIKDNFIQMAPPPTLLSSFSTIRREARHESNLRATA